MANLAVITGAISRIVVVDIDPKNGGDQSLATLEARHGALPGTIESITGKAAGTSISRIRLTRFAIGLVSRLALI